MCCNAADELRASAAVNAVSYLFSPVDAQVIYDDSDSLCDISRFLSLDFSSRYCGSRVCDHGQYSMNVCSNWMLLSYDAKLITVKVFKCMEYVIFTADKVLTSASVMDWCMSPHGIARPQNQSSPQSRKNVHWPDPSPCKILWRFDKKCPRYPRSEFVLRQKWTKIYQNHLRPSTP